jgi:hypothetical protein
MNFDWLSFTLLWSPSPVLHCRCSGSLATCHKDQWILNVCPDRRRHITSFTTAELTLSTLGTRCESASDHPKASGGATAMDPLVWRSAQMGVHGPNHSPERATHPTAPPSPSPIVGNPNPRGCVLS